jgi:lipopolysaccharide export system protein LptA
MVKIRDLKSIIIILGYVCINAFILELSFFESRTPEYKKMVYRNLAPEFTIIENLDYFQLKSGLPLLSLAADQMRSQGEAFAEFVTPKGVYNYQQKATDLKYQALTGIYKKEKETLTLDGMVKLNTDDAEYTGDHFKYFLKKDLIYGKGNVKVVGDDLKSHDHVIIEADALKAYPERKWSRFKGNVRGSMVRKKNYEGKLTFSSLEAEMNGVTSLAQLIGDVKMRREGYFITARKGDIFLENFNKSLKYFVFNDDVKVTETVKTPEGITQRKAFAERLEGYGREDKMVLSGAPRVEMGKDVVKGYRITLRQNIDVLEVDDAMSDMEVKKSKKKEKN